MKSRTKWVVAILAASVLVGIWRWRTVSTQPPERPRATEAASVGTPAGGKPGVPTGAPLAPSSSLALTGAVPSPPDSTASSTDVLQLLDTALANPQRQVKMKEVPPLSAALEAELIRRFEETPGITNRCIIAQILTYGGSTRVTGLMTNMLVRDYAGQTVADGEKGRLLRLCSLLGVTAQRDDSALSFLLAGVEAGTWERVTLWNTPIEPQLRISGLRECCLVGLAISGRPEAMALIEELRGDLERAADLDIQGGMLDAVFSIDRIKEAGLAGLLDLSFEDVMRYYAPWRERTTNGVAWGKWRGEIETIRYKRTHQSP